MDESAVLFVSYDNRTGRSSWGLCEPAADLDEPCVCPCNCVEREDTCEADAMTYDGQTIVAPSCDGADSRFCHCWHTGCVCCEVTSEV